MACFGDRRGASYYDVLGVRPGAPSADVRTAYRKLAMKWHPDRWSNSNDALMADEAKRKFQGIQEAYGVLSDQTKKTLYDAGLYDSGETEEEVEGFAGFMQEMVGLMSNVRREEKSYNMNELWGMLQDMGRSGSDGSSPASSYHRPSEGSRRGGKRRNVCGDRTAKMNAAFRRENTVTGCTERCQA